MAESEGDVLVFRVERDPAGGYCARAIGAAIFTEADDAESLNTAIRDAVICHFDAGVIPARVRLSGALAGVLLV